MSELNPTRRRRFWFGRRALFLLALPVLAVAALFIPRAWAHGRWGCGHGRELSAGDVRDRMKHGAAVVLDRVDATDAQRAAVDQVVDGLGPDVVKLREDHEKLRADFKTALAREQLDRVELERLRGAAIELADRASRRGLEALMEAGTVLSFEQRKALVEQWGRRFEH